jgi:hypothetical protein
LTQGFSTARSPRRWLPPPRHPAPEPAAERTRGTSLHPHPGAGSQPGPLRLSARALRSITAQPHISLAAGPIRPTTALLLDPPGCGHRRLHPRLRFPGSAHAASPKKRNHPERPLTQIEASSRPPSIYRTLGRHQKAFATVPYLARGATLAESLTQPWGSPLVSSACVRPC